MTEYFSHRLSPPQANIPAGHKIALTEIQNIFKEKLDIDYIKYRILGACNPTLAKQALDHQPEVGMLLPCNVIFWENEDGTVTISAVDAEQQLKATDQEDLVQLGRDVDGLLRQAVDSIL